MTVKFTNKYTGEVIVHKGVAYIAANETWLGTTGYAVHFEDSKFCIMSNETFELAFVYAIS